jgi:hypothetical protein
MDTPPAWHDPVEQFIRPTPSSYRTKVPDCPGLRAKRGTSGYLSEPEWLIRHGERIPPHPDDTTADPSVSRDSYSTTE